MNVNPENDNRISRSIWFAENKSEYPRINVLPYEKILIKGKKIEFIKPNTISLSLSVSRKELVIAKDLFQKRISPILFSDIKLRVINKELQSLYDYFEAVQSSLIFSYIAVEGFCNISIPNNFTYEKENNKGIIEKWNKDSIERWMTTSEKLKDVLPQFLNCGDLKAEPFWSDFLLLEKIRNNIVHPKTNELLFKDSQSHYEEFLKDRIFRIIESGYILIEHLCKFDTENILYPRDFWDKKEVIYKVNSFSDLGFLNKE